MRVNMSKYKLFFSHSTNDKDFIIKIKEIIKAKTFGNVEFFVSSDGESIRLGNRFLENIIEGLDTCHKLFAFVTPQSLQSDWIMFESGFAHAKGVDIVPICCLGTKLEALPSPIKQFQGKELYCANDVNDLIELINKELDTCFPANVTESDWIDIEKYFPLATRSQMMKSIKTSFIASKEYINQVSEYLKLKNMKYTSIEMKNELLVLDNHLDIQYHDIEGNANDYLYFFNFTPSNILQNKNFINEYINYFMEKNNKDVEFNSLYQEIIFNNNVSILSQLHLISEKLDDTYISINSTGKLEYKSSLISLNENIMRIESKENQLNDTEINEIFNMLLKSNIISIS